MIGVHSTEPGLVLASPLHVAPTAATAGSPSTREHVTGWTAGRTLRAVLLLAVAAGLVLMHHVIGAHQHAADQPVDSSAHVSMQAAAGHAVPVSGPSAPGASPDTSASRPAPATAPALDEVSPERSTTAALHVHHDQAGHDDIFAALHMCLAVLAAALALAFAHHFVGRRYDLERERPARTPRRAQRNRPPLPVPLRLAQLQVLRL